MSALDPRIAQQLAADLPGEVCLEIVETYCADLRRLNADLQQAALAGDGATLRQAAHALAGAAGSIGAVPLAGLARAIMQPAAPAGPDMAAQIGAATAEALAELELLAGRLRRG